MKASQTDSFQTFEPHQLREMGFGPTGVPIANEDRGQFDEQVRVVDENGQPIGGIPYHIKTSSGATHKGLTDMNGYCPRVYTKDEQQLDIAIGMRALERWGS